MEVLVSVAYMIAAAMNLLGLYSSYTFAEALRTDLLRMTPATPLTETRSILYDMFVSGSRVPPTSCIHLKLTTSWTPGWRWREKSNAYRQKELLTHGE